MHAQFICPGCGSVFTRRPSEIIKSRTMWCSRGCFYQNGYEHSGDTEHPLWSRWQGLRQRCNNPREKQFPNYGGRGITVCPEWETSFDQFCADMGAPPTPEHTVERIDVNGPYSPENCRWATPLEQSHNRRNNRLLTFDSRTQPLSAWAAEVGLSQQALSGRLALGWSLEKALSTPSSRVSPPLTPNGKTKSVQEWADESGIPPHMIKNRIKRGWSPESAVSFRPWAKGPKPKRPTPG